MEKIPDEIHRKLNQARTTFCSDKPMRERREAFGNMYWLILDLRDMDEWLPLRGMTTEIAAALNEADRCIEAMNEHVQVVQLEADAHGENGTAEQFIETCRGRIWSTRQECEIFADTKRR